MHDYTPEELKRGRFLRHFMGFDRRLDNEPTEEQLAIPAGAELQPRTRETARPARVQRG